LFSFTKFAVPSSGRVGAKYLGSIITSNGYGPYSWALSGNVPPGLTVETQPGDGSAAWISGYPITAGRYNVTVSVTDAAETISKSVSITIKN
jgi:hypothetical protein